MSADTIDALRGDAVDAINRAFDLGYSAGRSDAAHTIWKLRRQRDEAERQRDDLEKVLDHSATHKALQAMAAENEQLRRELSELRRSRTLDELTRETERLGGYDQEFPKKEAP